MRQMRFDLLSTLIGAFLGLGLLLWAAGYHPRKYPTEDQLYGCTWANTDLATGECK